MRNLRGRLVPIFVTFVALAVATRPVDAEAPKEPAKGWEFAITPYLWGAGINGTIGIGDVVSGGVNASFSDILSNLQMAAMGTFEVRKNRWGLLFDGIYVDLSDTVPTPDQVVYGDADVDLSEQIYTGLVGYRAYDGQHTTVDAVFGARYVRIDTSLMLTGGVAAGRSASGTTSWWDWMAGTRILGHPGKNWTILGYVDIGGGGSDLDWDALFGAAYAFNKTISLPFGYRYLSIDYAEDLLTLDTAMAGPYVGVGFHW